MHKHHMVPYDACPFWANIIKYRRKVDNNINTTTKLATNGHGRP